MYFFGLERRVLYEGAMHDQMNLSKAYFQYSIRNYKETVIFDSSDRCGTSSRRVARCRSSDSSSSSLCQALN